MTRVPHPTVYHVKLYDKSASSHRLTGKPLWQECHIPPFNR